MMYKTVIVLTLIVIVNSECENGCKQLQEHARVKRGKYYSYPPRIYNLPPMPFPVKGPFSYTPPPFMADDEAPYPGRPYKVSKRPTPTNDGLRDDDISNLVKHLSKQDLDKLLEFAQEKDQRYKYKEAYNTNEYTRPHKRESKIVYKGINTRYEEPAYKEEFKFSNYVTEPSYVRTRPIKTGAEDYFNKNIPYNTDSIISSPPKDIETLSPYMNSQVPVSFPRPETFEEQEVQTNIGNIMRQIGPIIDNIPTQAFGNVPSTVVTPNNNPYFTESNEEEKLPQPVNMREEDFEISYTNNVPKVVKTESSSYDVENFGDLPLMDYYNSKLHDVSSYHVPHYTVTQPKPLKPVPSPPVSFPSSPSSLGLKPSPAAAAIKEPVFEAAPPPSAAKEQSDAHLKAVKIWSHKSKGAAYTLHDDGSLTPERSRPRHG